jgi:hypothetical protein
MFAKPRRAGRKMLEQFFILYLVNRCCTGALIFVFKHPTCCVVKLYGSIGTKRTSNLGDTDICNG